MKIKWKTLIICLAIPLAVGALSALLSGGGMEAFDSVSKPALSPPAWLFPVVWSVLYILMGIASYLVVESGADSDDIRNALTVYGVQLAFNFAWSLLFFALFVYRRRELNTQARVGCFRRFSSFPSRNICILLRRQELKIT